MLGLVDLLALNVDEAAALVGLSTGGMAYAATEVRAIVEGTVEVLRHIQPSTTLSVTAGAQGSWTWDGKRLSYVPAYPVEVAGTTGAGDAHMAGILAGLAAGLPLSEAHELGALTAALSVTSPHTIHTGVDRLSLHALAERLVTQGIQVCAGVRLLLAG
jgi:sugar/nucleoside kinase (ribokinase family)